MRTGVRWVIMHIVKISGTPMKFKSVRLPISAAVRSFRTQPTILEKRLSNYSLTEAGRLHKVIK